MVARHAGGAALPRTIASCTAGVRSLATWLEEQAPEVADPVQVTPSRLRRVAGRAGAARCGAETVGARCRDYGQMNAEQLMDLLTGIDAEVDPPHPAPGTTE